MLLGSEPEHSAAGCCSASPPARITVHLNGLAPDLVPVPADKRREWWEEDPKTAQHARHCLPLLMANSLGYFILSPGACRVAWSGEPGEDAVVESVDQRERFSVDNHSAHGSFTVQPGFIPTTSRAGDFLLINGIAKPRRPWFTVMEALIATWWQPGEFGIVCLLHGPGEHTIRRGEPLAQMLLYRAGAGSNPRAARLLHLAAGGSSRVGEADAREPSSRVLANRAIRPPQQARVAIAPGGKAAIGPAAGISVEFGERR